MTKRLKLLLFIFAALIAITIDWQTKLWAKKVLFYIRSKTYFDGHFMLDYAENKGAALSFGANLPESQAFWVLQILPMVLLVLIVSAPFLKSGVFNSKDQSVHSFHLDMIPSITLLFCWPRNSFPLFSFCKVGSLSSIMIE